MTAVIAQPRVDKRATLIRGRDAPSLGRTWPLAIARRPSMFLTAILAAFARLRVPVKLHVHDRWSGAKTTVDGLRAKNAARHEGGA